MHEHNKEQSDFKNPYIQIMFNINSKNVVNNNILSERQKDLKLELPHQLKPQKIDRTFIFPQKKTVQNSKINTKRAQANKSCISAYKLQDQSCDQNKKNKKKLTKNQKSNIQVSHSTKQPPKTKQNRKSSEDENKVYLNQEDQLNVGKAQSRSRQKIGSGNQVRQKIIDLMIKDYEKGFISTQNFKDAISSLIDKQRSGKRNSNKSQIKTQKSKTYITNSHKNSLATSLRNTPKHKPTKSKSQKFYHQQFSSNLKGKKAEQKRQRSPQIMQRIIQRKQFVNKIIIKGINSSLFLSNQFTQKQSPEKRQTIKMSVINTSDSVKQLRKQMQKNVAIPDDKSKNLKNRIRFTEKINIEESIQTKAAIKIQRVWRRHRTNNILRLIMLSIEQNQHNRLQVSRIQIRDLQLSQTLKNNSSKEQSNVKQPQSIVYEQSFDSNSLKNVQKIQNWIDQFEIRQQPNSDSQNYTKIQELQKQYALILKDNNQSKSSSSKEESYRETFSSIEKYKSREYQQPKQKIQQLLIEESIKSYLSSELELISSQKKSQSSSIRKQETTQKRVKFIQDTQIKKLTEILNVVKQQLTIRDNQLKNGQSNNFILQKIINLLENQRVNAQKQLKIYNQFNQKQPIQPKVSFTNNRNDLSQNQKINSFKKKYTVKSPSAKINDLAEQKYCKQKQSKLKSIGSQSSLSKKSVYSSSSYSNHLQRQKISELNIDYIKIGLKKRLKDLELKKSQQIDIITQKFINDKITPKQYQEQRGVIQKWFKMQTIQLKKTQQKLAQGYRKAKQCILKDYVFYGNTLTGEKSQKMIKCISQKFLQKIENQVIYLNSKKQNVTKKDDESKNNIETRNLKKIKILKEITIKNEKVKQSEKIHQKNFQTIEQLQDQLLLKTDQNIRKKDSNQNQQVHSSNQESSSQSSPYYLSTSRAQKNQNASQQSNDSSMIKSRQYGIHDQEREFEQNVGLSGTHITKIQSQISSFLQKYEAQNLLHGYSEDKDDQNYDEYDQVEEKGDQYCESQVNLNYESSEGQTSENQVTQYNQEEYLRADNVSLRNEQRMQTNIIVNKKKSIKSPPQNMFSPQKTTQHEQFSQELKQYVDENESQSSVNEVDQFFDKRENENHKKFKYLNEDDKDDIFQFMFLDLCLEIFLQQTKNNKIMRSIEKHLIDQRKRRRIPKGFKTGLLNTRSYIQNFTQFVKANYSNVLRRLQSPMGPSAKQMLKFMREYQDQSSESQDPQSINLILPIQIYESYEQLPINKLILDRYYDDQQKQDSRVKFLTSLKHFHNKAIFDSINESLDLQRNYGIWGKPFPWKRNLSIDRHFSDQELKKKMHQATQKVIENCSYLCGVMQDKQDSVFGKSIVSEEYLLQIRQDRMSKMLSNQMLDNQDRWVFYEDQETQVLISITKFITSKLFSQVVSELQNLPNFQFLA